MNLNPTSTLASIIAVSAFDAEKNNCANHLIDRLLLAAIDKPDSHAARVIRSLADEWRVEQIRSQIERELNDSEPANEADSATLRADFFTKIYNLLSSVAIAGEPLNTGHILLLAIADPTTISNEILRSHLIGSQRLTEAMGVLEVEEDRHLDMSLQ